jgi:hypothetical protein
MNFRTEIKLGDAPFEINYQHQLMLVGSCFSDNIGDKLKEMKMKVLSNPFGISFNPYSIAQSISRIIQNVRYSDLEIHNDLYFSFDHHSSFSSSSKSEALERINSSLASAHEKLREADFLFITFGSAWVYRHISQNKLVANCHKIPNKEFSKELLSIENTTELLQKLIVELKSFNPKLKVVFTVSPVRHLKDGFIENQRSKSILLEAVHRIVEANSNCTYFPSYEIVMDDLRDYRFFKKDMLHLNDVGVDYVWEKFCDYYFTSETRAIQEEVNALNLLLQHRALNDSLFEEKKMLALKNTREKHPFLNW